MPTLHEVFFTDETNGHARFIAVTKIRKHLSNPSQHNKEILDIIHSNKKDGGMLIVKTLLCEFALAACDDS